MPISDSIFDSIMNDIPALLRRIANELERETKSVQLQKKQPKTNKNQDLQLQAAISHHLFDITISNLKQKSKQ